MHQKKAYHAFPAASAQVSRCTFPDHAPRAPGEGCKRAAPAEAPGEAFRYHRTAEEQKVRPVHTPGCRFSRKALPHRRAQPASVAPLPAARKRPARKSLRTCHTSVKKEGALPDCPPAPRRRKVPPSKIALFSADPHLSRPCTACSGGRMQTLRTGRSHRAKRSDTIGLPRSGRIPRALPGCRFSRKLLQHRSYNPPQSPTPGRTEAPCPKKSPNLPHFR